MSSGPNMPADPPMPDVLEVAASGSKPFCINFGSGAPSARLVCGSRLRRAALQPSH
jgi:hypothetical protein